MSLKSDNRNSELKLQFSVQVLVGNHFAKSIKLPHIRNIHVISWDQYEGDKRENVECLHHNTIGYDAMLYDVTLCVMSIISLCDALLCKISIVCFCHDDTEAVFNLIAYIEQLLEYSAVVVHWLCNYSTEMGTRMSGRERMREDS